MQPTRCYVSQFIYSNKTGYMFQAVSLPIIRSSNCTYIFWYLSNLAAVCCYRGWDGTEREQKRPRGRHRLSWNDNTERNLKETGREMQGINLAYYSDKWRALVNTVTNLRLPQNCWKFLVYKKYQLHKADSTGFYLVNQLVGSIKYFHDGK
jgi:hypothetical protein